MCHLQMTEASSKLGHEAPIIITHMNIVSSIIIIITTIMTIIAITIPLC